MERELQEGQRKSGRGSLLEGEEEGEKREKEEEEKEEH